MNTVWLDFLRQQGAQFPQQRQDELVFTSAAEEASQAATALVMAPLVHLSLIRVSGEDATVFLHNLFSNDVKKLAADRAQLNSFNSAKGRMLASFQLWRETNGDYLMAVSADIAAAIHKKLGMYILRSKVKLSLEEDRVLLGVTGADLSPIADALQPLGLGIPSEIMGLGGNDCGSAIRLSSARLLLALPVTHAIAAWQAISRHGARPVGIQAWMSRQIAAGEPLITAVSQEEFVAQMLNFELIGGVSFNKGCYPGQEIVARTQYLGKLKKRLYRLALANEADPGCEIFSPTFQNQAVGRLVNIAPSAAGGFEALAVIQSSEVEGELFLSSLTGPRLTLLPLPYSLVQE
jgi:folate-binding protein YgfZ